MKLKKILSAIVAATMALSFANFNVMAANVEVDTADKLTTAVASAAEGDTITVTGNISDVAVTVEKSLTITGNATLDNVSITATGTDVKLTVSNLKFTGNSWINSGSAKELTVSGVTANVAPVNGGNTANNATNSNNAFIALGTTEQKTLKLTVENSSVIVPAGVSAILGWAQITEATISGNNFGDENNYIRRGDTIANAAKFMSIADGAKFTVTGNTVYTESNGFAFYQNTTRNNAYTVFVDGNTFYGGGDHIWVEIGGTTTTKATINATSNNTVDGKTFTVGDIKKSRYITTWTSYAGVDVVTNSEGKVIGGTLAFYGEDVLAEGYKTDENGNVIIEYLAGTLAALVSEDNEDITLLAPINSLDYDKVGITYSLYDADMPDTEYELTVPTTKVYEAIINGENTYTSKNLGVNNGFIFGVDVNVPNGMTVDSIQFQEFAENASQTFYGKTFMLNLFSTDNE